MDQFVVPQFIEVEDKIFGPITVRQFLILLVGGLLIFLAYRFGDFAVFVTALVVLGSLSLISAFLKVNGQTFHYFLLNIFETMRKPSLRLWYKGLSNAELEYLRKAGMEDEAVAPRIKPAAKRMHIRNLALVVNTGGYYRPDEGLDLGMSNPEPAGRASRLTSRVQTK